MRVLALLFTLAMVPSAVSAGPFGFHMGMTAAEMRATGLQLAPTGFGSLVMTSPTAPSPHPSFELYILLFDSRGGLAKIRAVGPTTSVSPPGEEFRSQFEKIETALVRKYGRSAHKVNRLIAVYTQDALDRMMKYLLDQELAPIEETWQGDLPDSIGAIALSVTALSVRSGYVSLSYEFLNFEDAQRAIKEQEDDAL